MQLSIPAAAGTEASVKRELKRMGYGDCPALQGRVAVEGDWADIARLNVCLRTGERVLLTLARFPAPTFDALYEGVFALPWEEFCTPHTRILMDGKCRESALMAVKAAGGVVKKAVIERLRQKLGARTFDERGERLVVDFEIFRDEAVISVDTSGDGLHKRGYRVKTYDAPLRETAAASIVESSFFHAGKPFADLFCGSGTIPIEAALYMRRIAPGKGRAFDFERWKCAPAGLVKEACAAAEAEEVKGELPPLFACDISPKAVEIARFHAARAGVARDIRFAAADMRAFSSKERYGVIVSNPPYGERLHEQDLAGLYRDLGKVFRALPDWSCVFLSAYAGAERAFGGRPSKKRRLSNARLACTLYTYEGKKPPPLCKFGDGSEVIVNFQKEFPKRVDK